MHLDVVNSARRLMKHRFMYQSKFGVCLQRSILPRRLGDSRDASMQVEIGVYKPQCLVLGWQAWKTREQTGKRCQLGYVVIQQHSTSLVECIHGHMHVNTAQSICISAQNVSYVHDVTGCVNTRQMCTRLPNPNLGDVSWQDSNIHA